MKKILAGVLALCICGGVLAPLNQIKSAKPGFTAFAEEEEEYEKIKNDNFIYRKYSDHIAIDFIKPNNENIVIPDKIDGLPVTDIERFSNIVNYEKLGMNKVKSITIPDSVTNIGFRAFAGYSGIEKISLPKKLTHIGGSAFHNCSSLKEIYIPNTVEVIEGNAFDACSSLKEINIPNTVEVIGPSAFSRCESLQTITLPRIKYIAQSLFSRCKSLESIEIPDSVEKICSYAFEDCESLKSIVIPDSVNKLGTDASNAYEIFANCTSLESVKLSNNISVIPNRTFEGCTSLSSIDIPKNIKKIDVLAFSGCTNLKSVNFADPFVLIFSDAFEGTYWLDSHKTENQPIIIDRVVISGNDCKGTVVIPKDVIYINCKGLYNCEELENVIILNPECKIADSRDSISNGIGKIGGFFTGTIYGYKDSTAQEYAEKYSYKFDLIENAPAEYLPTEAPTEPPTESPTDTSTEPTAPPTEIPTESPTDKPSDTPTEPPTEEPTADTPELLLGDPGNDGVIDASDASFVLMEYALTSTGGTSKLTDAQKFAADVNQDGTIDASDASSILMFYSYSSTGGTETDMEKWLDLKK